MRVEAFCDGDWESSHVLLDGERLDPRASQAVWNHSPGGFSWGYGGSGPAQLALAILLAAGVDEDTAVRLHQDFKFEFIAGQPQTRGWVLDLDVVAWATRAQSEQVAEDAG